MFLTGCSLLHKRHIVWHKRGLWLLSRRPREEYLPDPVAPLALRARLSTSGVGSESGVRACEDALHTLAHIVSHLNMVSASVFPKQTLR